MILITLTVLPLCAACQRARREMRNQALIVPYAKYRCFTKNGWEHLCGTHYKIYRFCLEDYHLTRVIYIRRGIEETGNIQARRTVEQHS